MSVIHADAIVPTVANGIVLIPRLKVTSVIDIVGSETVTVTWTLPNVTGTITSLGYYYDEGSKKILMLKAPNVISTVDDIATPITTFLSFSVPARPWITALDCSGLGPASVRLVRLGAAGHAEDDLHATVTMITSVSGGGALLGTSIEVQQPPTENGTVAAGTLGATIALLGTLRFEWIVTPV